MSIGNEISMGDALSDMFKKMKLDDDVLEFRIQKTWNEIMNQAIKNRVSKLAFKKGTLFVSVQSHALRQELFMSRFQLRDRLNEELKGELIKEVILK